jgi:hypothetical protein
MKIILILLLWLILPVMQFFPIASQEAVLATADTCTEIEVWPWLGREVQKGGRPVLVQDTIWNEYNPNTRYVGFPEKAIFGVNITHYYAMFEVPSDEIDPKWRKAIYLTVKLAIKVGLTDDCRSMVNPKILGDTTFFKRKKLVPYNQLPDETPLAEELTCRFNLRDFIRRRGGTLADDEDTDEDAPPKKLYYVNQFIVTSYLEDANGKRICTYEYIRPVCLPFEYSSGF